MQESDEALDRYWRIAHGEVNQEVNPKANFLIKTGLLYRNPVKPKGLGGSHDIQLVIPSEIRNNVVRAAHESVPGIHMATKKTFQILQRKYWFKGIVAYTDRYCKACDTCQYPSEHKVEIMDEQIEPVISCSVATVVEEEDNPELAVTDEEIMIHYNTKQKESYLNVQYSENISQTRLKELKSLVFQFKEIFSDVPTITNLDEHKIDLTDDRPIRCKPYPVPLHLEDALNKEIDSMLNAGIIEPSEDYYASPVVLVKKPDGSIRVCVNYKALNAKTLVSPYPMLPTDDIMDKLGGSKFYSKFDLCKGYYQIPLEENSRKYSTLICKRGLYRFTVLPMGLVSAGATFTRMMRKLLNGTENLDSYLDDVLCHTKTWEDHISSLRVFLRGSKTQIFDSNLPSVS